MLKQFKIFLPKLINLKGMFMWHQFSNDLQIKNNNTEVCREIR